MAISIISNLRDICWSNNSIIFEFESDNRFEIIGQRFIAELSFTSGGLHNDTITLSWNLQSFEFVFKDIPDESGFQLPTQGIGQSMDEWLESIIQAFRNNYYLDSDFYFSVDTSSKIRFNSKKNQVKYNMEASAYSLGIDFTTIQNAVNEKMRENYGLYVEILIKSLSGVYKLFTRSMLEFDSNNKAIWDIQDYINSSLLENGIELPDWESLAIYKEQSSLQYFKLRYSEVYGYPQKMRKLESTSDYLAILGGVQFYKSDEFRLPEIFFDSPINKWITQTNQKRILAKQLDFISIINFHNNYSDVDVLFKLYSCDAQLIEKKYTIGSWNKYDKLVIPTGLNSINKILNEQFENVKSISISLYHENQLLSNSFHYEVDNTSYPFQYTLLFRNSLGCLESVFATGKLSNSYDIEKNEIAVQQQLNSNSYDQSLKEIAIELREKIKINSGFQNKSEIQKFRDFFLSKTKYILLNERIHSIVLESNSIEEFTDGNFLTAINFNVKLAMEQIHF